MPISLPPISRRTFLSRSILAGAGVALAPTLLAANKKRDEQSWALLADPHIAANRATVAHVVNMADHLAAVASEVVGLPALPGGAFVLGDCAYKDGQKEDYATLTDLLGPIREAGIPVHLALGNHDHRERFWDALKAEQGAKRPVADRQTALIRSPRANWFMLDSLEQTLATPGLLGSEQLDWLAKALDENRDQPALILVHHNPGKLANVEGMKDTEALFNVIRPRRQVKAYFFGHTHNWSLTQDQSGIHLINLPPVSYIFRKENPSGWVQAGIEADGARLELRCIDPMHKKHGQITELKWRV